MVNPPAVSPGPMVTVGGTVTAELLLLNVTTALAGAGEVSDTVHAEDPPGSKVELEHCNEASAAAGYPVDTVTGIPGTIFKAFPSAVAPSALEMETVADLACGENVTLTFATSPVIPFVFRPARIQRYDPVPAAQ